MGIVIVRVFGGGPIGSSLFCLNSELRIRQRNKEDKGQNITFIMKKKGDVGECVLCLWANEPPDVESRVRLMQAGVSPGRAVGTGARPQWVTGSALPRGREGGLSCFFPVPSSKITHRKRHFLSSWVALGWGRGWNYYLKGAETSRAGKQGPPPETIIVASQEAESQGLKGEAFESDRPGFQILVSTSRLCDHGGIPPPAKPHL